MGSELRQHKRKSTYREHCKHQAWMKHHVSFIGFGGNYHPFQLKTTWLQTELQENPLLLRTLQSKATKNDLKKLIFVLQQKMPCFVVIYGVWGKVTSQLRLPYGIKSAVRRFLFKIRDIPTKTKGKKSDPWRRFFYQVKKATIVPLFLPFRFFYRVSAFFTCTFLE